VSGNLQHQMLSIVRAGSVAGTYYLSVASADGILSRAELAPRRREERAEPTICPDPVFGNV